MTGFRGRNPADALKDPMWQMFMTFGQKPNYPALKDACYRLIQMSVQKTAGQSQRRKAQGKPHKLG